MKKILFLVVLGFAVKSVYGQGHIEAGYTPSRKFMKDEDNEKLGAGDMWQLRGRYTFLFSAKQKETAGSMVGHAERDVCPHEQ